MAEPRDDDLTHEPGEGLTLTPDLEKFITETLNKIVGARIPRMLKKALEPAITEAIAPVTEELSAWKEAQAHAAKEQEQTAESSQVANVKAEYQKQLEATNRKLEAMRLELAERDRKAQEAEHARQQSEMRHALHQTMQAAGASTTYLDVAVSDAFPYVMRGEDGAVYWRPENEFDDPMPLEAGVKTYLASDKGKRWMPAVPTMPEKRSRNLRPGSTNGEGKMSDADLFAAISGAPTGG